MNIEKIKDTSTLENNFSELNSYGETFQRTLSSTLASQSSSCRPKMEFSGILLPNQDAAKKRRFPYTLRTQMNKYYLQIGDALGGLARGLEWKEVIVRGPFDFDAFAIEAEELKPSRESAQHLESVPMAG